MFGKPVKNVWMFVFYNCTYGRRMQNITIIKRVKSCCCFFCIYQWHQNITCSQKKGEKTVSGFTNKCIVIKTHYESNEWSCRFLCELFSVFSLLRIFVIAMHLFIQQDTTKCNLHLLIMAIIDCLDWYSNDDVQCLQRTFSLQSAQDAY